MLYLRQILTLALVTCAYARPVAHDEMASALTSKDHASLMGSDGGHEGVMRQRALEPALTGQPNDKTDGGYVGACERDYAVNGPHRGYEGISGDGWHKTDIPAVSNPEGGHGGDEGFRKGDAPAVSNPDGGYIGQVAGTEVEAVYNKLKPGKTFHDVENVNPIDVLEDGQRVCDESGDMPL
ncbi:hypothetical protein ATEIFO6365_0009043000 [Aspergillus terreus]|uniref:Uncharacterized protein n=1 Tax=Aspergillus terreus TaxID=33178 RepID=A0A5M3Z8M8_ASPTE|nr:hypothetical protein ATETN484_0011042500 [Aspergillus terreus]GFF19067.1 hypothetical protein ATEIFO6365_0009043000 [Aspergillus terreus]